MSLLEQKTLAVRGRQFKFWNKWWTFKEDIKCQKENKQNQQSTDWVLDWEIHWKEKKE